MIALLVALTLAPSPDPPIYMHGTACIHAVVFNEAVDGPATVRAAVAWWQRAAPAAHFDAIITTEAWTINDLRTSDPRPFTWYYGTALGEDWEPRARAQNAERARASGCATSWTVFFVPTAEASWAGIYGALTFVATRSPLGADGLLAHEMGHIYGALDQVREARVPCTQRSGILNIETQNSDQGCLLRADSIMKNPAYAYPRDLVDRYALMQMGAFDSDGDGVADPDDPTPTALVYLPMITAR